MSSGDPELFKRMTSAYTQALLISSKRDREPASSRTGGGSSSSSSRSSSSYGGFGRQQQQRTTYYGGFGPSAYRDRARVDNSRFNHREWDKQHYNLHGETAEQRQSEYIRNLANAERRRSANAQAQRAARQQAGQQARRAGGSFGALLFSMAACSAVWSAVYQTNAHRFR